MEHSLRSRFVLIHGPAGILLLSILLAGCASPPLVAEPPTGGLPLGPDEGYLILQIDTDVPLESATFKTATAISNLPKGRHVWIVRAPAGHYEWDEIHTANSVGAGARIDISDYARLKRRKDWVWDDEYEFEVLAGHVNYPGDLIIKSEAQSRSVGRGYWVRNRNHSAMAIRELMKSHSAILNGYPIRHTGAGTDEFLEYYSRVRDRASRDETHPPADGLPR